MSEGLPINDETRTAFGLGCRQLAHVIHVRVGSRSVPLASLPPAEQDAWIDQWWERRRQQAKQESQ